MKNITAPIIMVIFIFISCTDDNDLLMSGDIVDISVTIPGYCTGIDSRTSITTTNQNPSGITTAFISGDNIGISETLTGKSNVSFSYNGTSWTTATPLYWYNGTSTHNFYAYYPYNSTSQQLSAAIPLLNKQTVSNLPDAARDMLVSSVSQARSAGTSVKFTMKHAFALLRFDIKMSILALVNPYNVDSLVIRGGNTTVGANAPYGMFNTVNNVSSISYSFTSSAIVINPNNNTTCTQVLRSTPPPVGILTTAVSFYVFVLPGNYANPVPAIKLTLSTLGLLPKQTQYFPLPNSTTLTAGNMYTYQVTFGLNTRSSDMDIEYSGKQELLPMLINSYNP